MHRFEYLEPSSLAEAISLLQDPGAEAMAGGTDLLGELKRGIRKPRRLVNLKVLPELRGVRPEEGGGAIHLGPLATLTELGRQDTVMESFPLLKQALSFLATQQLRNMGTLGGNLCQHPRCWYFRSALFPCWLKGGKICFAAAGENRNHAFMGRSACHSIHPSDLAPPLIAIGAEAKITGPGGERMIPLQGIYGLPEAGRRRATVLNPGDLITAIKIPPAAGEWRGIFLKAMERKAWSFALVSAAVCWKLEGGRIAEARVVLGGVAPIPWRSPKAEEVLQGQEPSDDLARRAAEAATEGARPLAQNGYKVQLAQALLHKAISSLMTTIGK